MRSQRQGVDAVRHRGDDLVTVGLVAHGARGNEEGRDARRAHDATRRII